MNITLFCSSSENIDPIFFQEAKILGETIGKNGHTLVYGGTKNGLMEAVAQSAKQHNAYLIGILPENFESLATNILDDHIVVNNLAERKQIMCEMADAFVVLAGGIGTLDELFSILAMKLVGEIDSEIPIYVINTKNHYNGIKEQLNLCNQNHFGNGLKLCSFIDNIQDLKI